MFLVPAIMRALVTAVTYTHPHLSIPKIPLSTYPKIQIGEHCIPLLHKVQKLPKQLQDPSSLLFIRRTQNFLFPSKLDSNIQIQKNVAI